MKKILVLGCTGSIGTNTLEIARNMKDEFTVCGLVAHTSREKITRLAQEFKCPGALTSEESGCIRRIINETHPDIAVNGIAGSDGLLPSVDVLSAGVDLALANKETVVMAWPLVKALADKNHASILPVDSEHSALFNLTERIGKNSISELIITASGGPFRTYSREQLEHVTVQQALNHPTWKMGKKITIDSASLANKGLEVIEACRLFGFPPAQVKVLVHPQSVVHSLVRTKDGMLYAQLSDPDMKHPILSALTWPAAGGAYMKPFTLEDETLSFFRPRMEDFPMLKYAYDAAEKGGSYTIAYNAADETAAHAFVDGKIKFADMADIVKSTLDKDWSALPASFEDVFSIDRSARKVSESSLCRLQEHQ